LKKKPFTNKSLKSPKQRQKGLLHLIPGAAASVSKRGDQSEKRNIDPFEHSAPGQGDVPARIRQSRKANRASWGGILSRNLDKEKVKGAKGARRKSVSGRMIGAGIVKERRSAQDEKKVEAGYPSKKSMRKSVRGRS